MWPFQKTHPTIEEANASNIGEILKKLGSICDEELAEAVAEQRRRQALGEKPDLLGEILIEHGRITRVELDAALSAQAHVRSAKKRSDAVLNLAEEQTRAFERRVAESRVVLDHALARHASKG